MYYRIVDVSVALVVDEDDARSTVVGKDLLDSHNMSKLVDEVPVLHVEVVQTSRLNDKQRKNVNVT